MTFNKEELELILEMVDLLKERYTDVSDYDSIVLKAKTSLSLTED